MKTITMTMMMALACLAACASHPPQQLLDARANYAAIEGPTQTLAPAELHDAKVALDAANEAYRRYGDTAYVRDLAYVASRKVELVNARASTRMEREAAARLVAETAALKDAQLSEAQKRARDAEAQLQAQREAGEAQAQSDENSMRVTEDARGVVISMSGVTFASGGADLDDASKGRIDRILDLVKDRMTNRGLLIEGHTDATGSEALNQKLSSKRAEAVRDYLVSRGIDGDKIETRGAGATSPVAPNTSAASRARNRRVDIILLPVTSS